MPQPVARRSEQMTHGYTALKPMRHSIRSKRVEEKVINGQKMSRRAHAVDMAEHISDCRRFGAPLIHTRACCKLKGRRRRVTCLIEVSIRASSRRCVAAAVSRKWALCASLAAQLAQNGLLPPLSARAAGAGPSPAGCGAPEYRHRVEEAPDIPTCRDEYRWCLSRQNIWCVPRHTREF